MKHARAFHFPTGVLVQQRNESGVVRGYQVFSSKHRFFKNLGARLGELQCRRLHGLSPGGELWRWGLGP